MDWNLNETRNIVDLVQTLGMLAIALFVWLRKPGEQAAQSVKTLEAAMSEQTAEITRNANEATAVLDRRLTVVEQAVKHMPNNADLATLSGEVMTVKATVEGIKDSLTGMSSSVHRIENFLLRHGRGD